MNVQNILAALNRHYDKNIQAVGLFREGGTCSYIATAYRANNKYFLKTIRHPYLETALESVDIQMYLLLNEFPVIPIIFTKEGAPYVRIEEQEIEYLFILYDFIDGSEPAPEDTEEAGALVGKLHQVMKDYTGRLLVRDKHFFIDRYVEIMRKKQYSKWEAFRTYGNELWDRVKNLPRGYCHCDLYDGNIHKIDGGAMYVVDFDTSCTAFPMYDIVLFCNKTHYFMFDRDGYERSKIRLKNFVKGYLRYSPLTTEEISAFYDLIAVYHFQLQATVMETRGYDCVDDNFFDKQYDWLLRWKKQCEEMNNL
jgi:Ser/Thr protein kinase RdoA (MazF antagonist)